MSQHRILILTNRVPFPLHDGGALAMNAMLEGYFDQGWDIYLCAMNTSRHYVSQESLPKLYQKIRLDTFEINTDVKLVPTLKNFFLSKKPSHVDRFYDKDFEKKLEKIVSTFEPELIQVESIYLASYISALRKLTEAPVAVRLHNIEYQIWERLSEEASNTFKRFYLRDLAARIKRFEIEVWSAADVLIPITAGDAEIVRNLVPSAKLIVAPFGIDSQKLKKQSLNERWVGYHIGAMDWLPNVEALTWFLETVWPELHKQIPEFEFYFAGRNMPGAFEKYESDGITCEGEVPSASDFISDKKILIVPLRSGGGIRIKILEAMAAGKLVVSTSVGVQGIDKAEPGVHFLLADSSEDFVNQISFVMSNRTAAEGIAKAGAQLVGEEYDQKAIMARLVKNLLELK